MAETVDLCPVNVDGRVVYIAPTRLTAEAKRAWVAVLIVLALLALVGLAGKEGRP
jgi:hypothetical protein